MSPSPSIVKPRSVPKLTDFGQRILIGTSKDVATFTICKTTELISSPQNYDCETYHFGSENPPYVIDKQSGQQYDTRLECVYLEQ